MSHITLIAAVAAREIAAPVMLPRDNAISPTPTNACSILSNISPALSSSPLIIGESNEMMDSIRMLTPVKSVNAPAAELKPVTDIERPSADFNTENSAIPESAAVIPLISIPAISMFISASSLSALNKSLLTASHARCTSSLVTPANALLIASITADVIFVSVPASAREVIRLKPPTITREISVPISAAGIARIAVLIISATKSVIVAHSCGVSGSSPFRKRTAAVSLPTIAFASAFLLIP